MKRIFYSLILLVSTLALGSQLSAQYTINFVSNGKPAPPAVGSVGPQPAANLNDGNPIAVGVKFRVTQIGQITDLRFYKGDSWGVGTRVGYLWQDNGDNTGTLLATENFTGETLSGWQEQALTTPITVIPGNIYVASLYSPTGDYALTGTYFEPTVTNTGNAPLIVPAFDDPALNGFGSSNYRYNPGPLADDFFPNAYSNFTGEGPNYWIDVEFAPTFPLPVTLVDFKAIPNGKNVGLNWSTASEENNKGFEIQRSNNNTDWYTIGFVSGAGNSSSTRNYSYTDKELASGKYYYRLRQIDLDARIKLSSTALANISGIGQISLFQNFPNPVVRGGITTIRFDLPEDQRTRISLLDITGREVKLLADKTAQQGSHIITFDVSGLSKQMYIIRMQTAGEVITRKMMIQ